jgi:hypothetical protein
MFINCPHPGCSGILGIFNPGGPSYDQLLESGVHTEEIAPNSIGCPACRRAWAGTITYRRVPPDEVKAEATVRVA